MTEPLNLESFVQDTFSEAWRVCSRDAVLFLLAGLIVIFLGGLTLGVLLGPLVVGFIRIVDRRRKGEAATASDVFSGMERFLPAFLATLAVGLTVILGTFLLVLPGLVAAYLAMFVWHPIALRGVGAGAALFQSFKLIQAHFGVTLILFLLLMILNGLGSAVMLGTLITFPFSLVVLSLAFERLSPPRT